MFFSSAERCNTMKNGHSYGQLVIGSFITTTLLLMHHTCVDFGGKHQITQGTKPPYSPDLHPVTSCFFQN